MISKDFIDDNWVAKKYFWRIVSVEWEEEWVMINIRQFAGEYTQESLLIQKEWVQWQLDEINEKLTSFVA